MKSILPKFCGHPWTAPLGLLGILVYIFFYSTLPARQSASQISLQRKQLAYQIDVMQKNIQAVQLEKTALLNDPFYNERLRRLQMGR